MERSPIVGVMGSGRHGHPLRAEPLGKWLASIGVHLLTGGGDGVMRAVSRAFVSVAPREGKCIGVLPSGADGVSSPPGYPNPWIEIPIRTHLSKTGRDGGHSSSRNHINILSSDVIVALPGSAGTATEVELAVRYGRPVIAYVDDRSEIPGLGRAVTMGRSLTEVQEFVRSHLPR